MFCASCGRSLGADLRFCDGCGVDLPVAGVATAAVPPRSGQFTAEVKARSLDAWQGIKLFARSPVAGLAESFALFDDGRAARVGSAYAAVYAVAVVLGIHVFVSKTGSLLGGLGGLALQNASPSIPKLAVLSLIPFASLIAALTLVRTILQGTGRIGGDIYTAGAVLIPWGLLVLAGAILGAANVEVTAMLALFALTYSILMLHTGCARICLIPEASAAPAVPVILVATAWVTKIVAVATW